MGYIGEPDEQEEIELEPFPASEPITEPAAPAPEKEPAAPVEEPAPV